MKNSETISRFVSAHMLGKPIKGFKNNNGTLIVKGHRPEVIYSYGEHYPLGVFDGSAMVINKTNYSKTTSYHRSLLARTCEEMGLPFRMQRLTD